MKVVVCILFALQLLTSLPNTHGDIAVADEKCGIIVCIFVIVFPFSKRLIDKTGNGTQAVTTSVRDKFSMLELHSIDKGLDWSTLELPQISKVNDSHTICSSNQSLTYKHQILKGIEKTLKFYDEHWNALKTIDATLALTALKGVDNKHGKRFQTSYPISDWITGVCNTGSDTEGKEFCTKLSDNWKHRQNPTWKSAGTLMSTSNTWKSVGHEKEVLWGKLNGECQLALINHCEVPYVCERTLYDSAPKSQYFLTHQMFQRILTEQSDCPAVKSILNEEVNDQLLSKMYQEAMLVSQLEYPHILRDLFAEYILMGGYMRYPNFFREDWIVALLSWQSKSEYGCFSHDKMYKSAFVTSDVPIVRQSTPEELGKGLVSEENCLPHFTAVGLSALAMSWDFMEENCP